MTTASLLRAEEGLPRSVQGAADPRFANVVRVFSGLFPGRRFGGGALSVYIDGRPVVDVWTGWSDRDGEQPWTADTGAMVFSATKGVAATVIHRLVDRGLLSYDEPVAQYWPEFGANGKDGITVRDVLRHRSGLSHLKGVTKDDLLDHLLMEERLAAASADHLRGWPAYHALTYGGLLSGLARSVTGLGMRDLIRDEVACPLNTDGLHLGRPPAGRRRFRGAELDVVEEWAFDAAKELVRSDGEVSELEAAVLVAVGVDPGIHATWPIHRGGCDGGGGDSCDARIAELAAQRFEEQEAVRHQRRERARSDAELIASGAFRVGQCVLAYYDSRAAVVTKINRVTVKVKHVGGQADHYQLVEKSYSPVYLHALPEPSMRAAAALSSGRPVQVLDWGRRRRTGEILRADGPLLQVQHQLASGQARSAWIDVLGLDGGQA